MAKKLVEIDYDLLYKAREVLDEMDEHNHFCSFIKDNIEYTLIDELDEKCVRDFPQFYSDIKSPEDLELYLLKVYSEECPTFKKIIKQMAKKLKNK
jgi:hypothetical protein